MTDLDRVVSHDPEEMLAVVEAGIGVGALRQVLAEGGQEWPSDAPRRCHDRRHDRGGRVLAPPAQDGPTPRQRRGARLVTGDGRLVRSGARTVKSVQGYDLHRLATGSLGTLGAIVQVAVKVRPLPKARRLVVSAAGGLEAGRTLLHAVPLPLLRRGDAGRIEVALEGWPRRSRSRRRGSARLSVTSKIHEGASVGGPEAVTAPIVAEVAVAPSRLDAVLGGADDWRALMGVGIAWVGLPDSGRLASLRTRVAEAEGSHRVIRGPGGLGEAPVAALEVHRRLKASFDPSGILAPGRFWAGLCGSSAERVADIRTHRSNRKPGSIRTPTHPSPRQGARTRASAPGGVSVPAT